MTTWFCQRDGRTGVVKRRNLDLHANGWMTHRPPCSIDEPAQAVLQHGIAGDYSTSVVIEDDGREDHPPEPDPGKPSYRVPSMAEVEEVPWNGLRVASLFAGAGGSSLGYRMAGFRVAWANEFVPSARAAYRANASHRTLVDGRDVRLVAPAEVLAACGLAEGELDLLDGSPPCQAFSTAGRREKGWGEEKSYEGGAKQRNEDLFAEYVRLLRGLKPRAFVAENVSGLAKGVAKGFFLEILAELRASGYAVECRLLDAQWLGVPQQRQRLIFVGVREDLGLEPAFPSPLSWRYSVRDAIPWISDGVTGRLGTGYERRAVPLDAPMPTINASGAAQTRFEVPEAEADISRYAIGAEADKLLPGGTSEKYFQLQRAHPDRPSPAILAQSAEFPSAAAVIHPTEKRRFTLAELRRICSFPDDFELPGTYAQGWACLGNSVPPLMMRAVAEAVRDGVLGPARARTGAPA